LPKCAGAAAEIWNYPSLPEFPRPYLLGYPQFPPSAFTQRHLRTAQKAP
jgi:hypothetical protein